MTCHWLFLPEVYEKLYVLKWHLGIFRMESHLKEKQLLITERDTDFKNGSRWIQYLFSVHIHFSHGTYYMQRETAIIIIFLIYYTLQGHETPCSTKCYMWLTLLQIIISLYVLMLSLIVVYYINSCVLICHYYLCSNFVINICVLILSLIFGYLLCH